MVLHPEVQAKAQAEIDRVVGKDRLPDFDDRPALPYLEAIMRETLRWYPVVPLGSYSVSLSIGFS
jgi:cytochrome P450